MSVCLYVCLVFFFWFVYWSNRNCNGVHIFMGKCMQTCMSYFFFQVHVNVIISVCLNVCLFYFFGLCTRAIGIAMEYRCSWANVCKLACAILFCQVHIIVIMSVGLYLFLFWFVYWSHRNCNGSTYFCMGKCMQSRMCDFSSESLDHCNHKCSPLRLLIFMFWVCVLEQ